MVLLGDRKITRERDFQTECGRGDEEYSSQKSKSYVCHLEYIKKEWINCQQEDLRPDSASCFSVILVLTLNERND